MPSVTHLHRKLTLLGSAAMGSIALVPAYRKKHGRVSCLAMFGSGLLCLLLRRHIGGRAIAIEPVAVAMGATFIITAHALNLRFSRRCQCCEPAFDTNSLEAHECAPAWEAPGNKGVYPLGIGRRSNGNE